MPVTKPLVAVQDLNLTVWQQPGHSTIEAEEVYAGSYRKVGDSAAGWVTVSFGDLFSGEARKVLVRVLLPAVHNEHRVAVLLARCSYRVRGETFYCPRDHRMRCFMRRARSASPGAMNAEVEQELERIIYVDKIDEAIATGDYDSAHRKLGEHQKVLEARPPNRMIRRLWEELAEAPPQPQDLGSALRHPAVVQGVARPPARRALRPRRACAGAGGRTGRDEEETTGGGGTDVGGLGLWGGSRECRSSGWWAWATVILCTVLAIAVILAGAAVFAVYTLFKPKMPYLAVSDARLGLLQYDQGGTIQSLQMSITIRAENNNSRADATFSRVDLALGFHGVDVALLRAEPFVVARESSLPLRYNVVSVGRTLDAEGMQAMDAALKASVVPFDLLGKARTRWKVGVFVRLRYWTRIWCRLRLFFPGNGTVVPTDRDRCRSR
ncbi:unnamed protein product [Miscanthus lutarioriparius]|uniref:Late embryogenesis abundant protein LEA-2 subgroup domain-containing protein n=1 Tax=Miscanthus lutarioriparius TaxID=422564 RepID=A0A811QVI5_9POAL|nr:unnamed protein product [Miscanthus lutarioriparius]